MRRKRDGSCEEGAAKRPRLTESPRSLRSPRSGNRPRLRDYFDGWDERTQTLTGAGSERLFDAILCLTARKAALRTFKPLRERLREWTAEDGWRLAERHPFSARVGNQPLSLCDWERIEDAGFVAKAGADVRLWEGATVVKCGEIALKRKDFTTLHGARWLNDEIINAYMQLLRIRSAESPNTNYRSLYPLSTHLYRKYCGTGYSGVRRWTRKVDLFEHDVVVVPVHRGECHWTLAAVDLPNRKVFFFDSRGSCGSDASEAILQYLREEHLDKRGIEADFGDFKLVSPLSEVPQQSNTYDCGVFTCQFANSVAAQRPFTFSQSDMPYLRARMALELLERRVPMPP